MISKIFFFQAEDGIRDADVTGVQTCALPILLGMAILWAETGEKGGFKLFWAEAVLPWIVYFFIPMLLLWGAGYLIEKHFPHIIYRRPKGPKWELNRRTGMVTLYYDPDTDERAGEISAQAPFDEWDGYLAGSSGQPLVSTESGTQN